jgi:hypothetical protein
MNITDKTRFTNLRVASTEDSTLGIFYADLVPIGFVIEDEHREIKVKGETRIPQGEYKLGIRKEITPLTQRYRDKFNWFDKHIELLNVPGFTGIYIHVGNFESDTEGCQVIGFDASTIDGEFRNKNSTAFYKMFYEKVYPLLENGANLYYQIIDKDEF